MRRSFPFRDYVRRTLVSTLLTLAPAVLGATSYTILTTVDDAVVNGNCTLREAIRAANTNLAVDACPAGGAADTITLPTGTYPFSGGESLNSGGSLTIQSATLNPFNVSIDLGNAGRFLWLSGSGSYVLGGLEIKNGLAPIADSYGGAIFATGVSLQIFNFRFLSNHAAGAGGALYFEASSTGKNLVIHNGSFLTNSVASTGAATSSGGAAYVFVQNGADADLRDVNFIGNSVTASAYAAEGGALTLYSAQSGSVASSIRCHFQNNSAMAPALSGSFWAAGGAVHAWAFSGARTELVDCRFTGNWATASATAAKTAVLSGRADAGGSLLLERLFIDFNGGGLDPYTNDVALVGVGATSMIALYDSQLTFGTAGGLKAFADAVAFVLLGHLTIADYPGTGAALTSNGGPITLQNSIVARNGTDLTPFGNVIETTNFVGGDPLFLNELIGDYHLSALSPAINAGTSAAATVRFADLDHHPRIVGGVTDIGCYEYNGLFADNFEVGDGGSWSAVAP